jgi:hypothetical protein
MAEYIIERQQRIASLSDSDRMLFQSINATLVEWDPIDIIRYSPSGKDEHESEALDFLECVKKRDADTLQTRLYNCYHKSLSIERREGFRDECKDIAQKLCSMPIG